MGKTIASSNKKTAARRASRATVPSYRNPKQRSDASKRVSRRADRHRTSTTQIGDRSEVYCVEVHIDPEFRGRPVQVMSNMPQVREAAVFARLLSNAITQGAIDWHNAGDGELVVRSKRASGHHPAFGLMAKGKECLTPDQCVGELLADPEAGVMATELEGLRNDNARLQRELSDLTQKHQALLAGKKDTSAFEFEPLPLPFPLPSEAPKLLCSLDPNFALTDEDYDLLSGLTSITGIPSASAMECTGVDDCQLAKELAQHATDLAAYAARVTKELAIEKQQQQQQQQQPPVIQGLTEEDCHVLAVNDLFPTLT